MVLRAVVTRSAGRALLLVGLAPAGLRAQQGNPERCRAALITRGMAANRISATDPCFDLAAAIADAITATAWMEPRDVHPSGGATAAPAGSPAQAGAVPTIQPTPLASATVAAVAQDSGTSAITAVSINPATLFASTSDPRTLALLARLLDLTLFFPVAGLDENDDGRLDYAGVRLRVNFTAGAQSGSLREVGQRLTAIVRGDLEVANQIRRVLLAAPDPGECATQLTADAASADDIHQACGEQVAMHIDETEYVALRRAAARAREEADAMYFGLDLRFDTGDPTLGAVRNAAATALVAGLGFGRRFNPAATGAAAGVRGRLGVRYVDMRDTALVDWQVDGGVAFEASRLIQAQRLEFTAGFEFRFSGNRTASEILRTRYAEFRGGITVPLAGSTSIAVSVSAPIMGDVSPTLSVGGNWQQLLASAFRP